MLSKRCKACEKWKLLRGSEKYEKWKASQKCHINHFCSSGSMESAGTIAIFSRSIPQYNLRFTGYIGDGDSNSYPSVVAASPYGDVEIKKFDGKKISGNGRLTDKVINKMQNYYWLAIRQNPNQLYAMKKSILAILLRLTENDNEDDQHKCCPRTKDSWCKFQSDKLTGKVTYKRKYSLPKSIEDAVLPVFQELSKDELLLKCLHGQTQNANEALNKLIWQRCPKTTFVSKRIVDIAAASAILYFNDGCKGLDRVLHSLGIQNGEYTHALGAKIDRRRIINMTSKSSEKVKKTKTTWIHQKRVSRPTY